ncbi:MAG: hypothetical protein H0Z24_09660 [Thermosipho sp. (in: Bacteria)]|nr:hypothetical protein [Thermosipho sp. (in: thermotogales)]
MDSPFFTLLNFGYAITVATFSVVGLLLNSIYISRKKKLKKNISINMIIQYILFGILGVIIYFYFIRPIF